MPFSIATIGDARRFRFRSRLRIVSSAALCRRGGGCAALLVLALVAGCRTASPSATRVPAAGVTTPVAPAPTISAAQRRAALTLCRNQLQTYYDRAATLYSGAWTRAIQALQISAQDSAAIDTVATTATAWQALAQQANAAGCPSAAQDYALEVVAYIDGLARGARLYQQGLGSNDQYTLRTAATTLNAALTARQRADRLWQAAK